jgi:hypothetical protein
MDTQVGGIPASIQYERKDQFIGVCKIIPAETDIYLWCHPNDLAPKQTTKIIQRNTITRRG